MNGYKKKRRDWDCFRRCIHWDGVAGEKIIYVKPSCPRYGISSHGAMFVNKRDCQDCWHFREKKVRNGRKENRP